jgi:RND family efflux transporter MFP subunit
MFVRPSMSIKTAVAPGVMLALMLALAACKPADGSTPPPGPPPGPSAGPSAEVRPVRTTAVRLEPAEEVVRYAAVIRPRIESDLGFRVGGKMVERLVDVGARVEEGMALARLDPTDIALQVRAAEAQLASARADEANARTEHQRYTQLRQGEWTSRQELERRLTTLEKAAAHVHEIDAQLAVLRNTATYTTLKADSRGVVTAVLAEPGQVLPLGQAVLRVARDGAMEAVASIPEQQIARFADHRLEVEVWSLPGSAVPARLREIEPSADPGTRTYRARVALVDPPPPAIQLGMTATLVARHTVAPEPVARLPLSALVAAAPTTGTGTSTGTGATAPAVWVVGEGGRLERRPVRVLAYAGDIAVIAGCLKDSCLKDGGLKDGERVVTAGAHKLDAGQSVRLWTEAGQ